ncbi:hypothetical protein SUGI_0613830 [Cryptomeria japonica]|nr:hypothetical protein SUGI_0613830 [Cryptomeria japonica]
MCFHKESGGAGLRKMDLQNIALGAKLSWKMYREPQKLWCKIFPKKYLDIDQSDRILTVVNADRGSATWNFLWDCRSVITDHISWHIGSGSKEKFWVGSWEGEPTLNELIIDQEWINTIEAQYRSYVCANFDTDSSNGNIKTWKQVDIGYQEICDQLRNILSKRHILVSNVEDSIFSCGSKLGEYNVKLGYEAQRAKGPYTDWLYRLCWHNRLLPKADAFLWIALHNKILIGDRLKLIGISGPSICVLCKSAEETIDHLLFTCPMTEACWNYFFDKINYTTVRNLKLKDFLASWPSKRSSMWSDIWTTGHSMIVWHIWKERNRRICKEKCLPVDRLIKKK